MGAFDDLIPESNRASPAASRGGAFDDLIPKQQTSSGESGIWDTINRGVNWLGTQATKAATGALGSPRDMADLVNKVSTSLGGPAGVAQTIIQSNPVLAAGQFLPGSSEMNKQIFQGLGVPEVSSGNKTLDAATQAAISALAGPGSFARNVIPAAIGGAASEIAGQVTEGSKWEPIARAGAGLIAGGGAGAVQNLAGNVAKGVTNLVGANARNTDTQAMKIIARAMENDKTTPEALLAAQAEWPSNAPMVMSGGENMKGALRGSIAAPGPARTTAAEAFENYRSNDPARVQQAIDQNVSSMPPVAIRQNSLSQQRSAASTPAYEAAGVLPPDKIVRSVAEPGRDEILAYVRGQTPRPEPRVTFNVPTLESEGIKKLLQNQPIQSAMADARRLVPEYKDLPANSMVMLDEAYKMLGGRATAATEARDGALAFKYNSLRTKLRDAIVSENPAYGKALAAYSEPSALMDANKLGRDVFKTNVNNQEAKRLYSKLPADQQDEFLGGVADWLRERADNSFRGSASERIWTSNNIINRLKAVLPEDKFAQLSKVMEQGKTSAQTYRDVFKGSRSIPMAAEAADNSIDAGRGALNVARGNVFTGVTQLAAPFIGRVAEGRTRAINDRVAQMMTSPASAQLFAKLREAQQREALIAANRRNAILTGGLAPAFSGLLGP